MSSYREIVTKAVLGKGKKIFNHSHFVNVNNTLKTCSSIRKKHPELVVK